MASVNARRREMLWRRGVRRCARCGGALAGPESATLDHVVPRSVGGSRSTNLTLSHPDCNRLAGRQLWLERWQRDRGYSTLPARFWYEDLATRVASSAMFRSAEEFQILGPIQDAVTIAEGSAIRELARIEKYFGKGSWLKRKGNAVIRYPDGTVRRAELHWYEAHGIGRRWIRVKRHLDL